MRTITTAIAIASSASLLTVSNGNAATLFVASSGVGTYPSIAAALLAAAPNDTIQLSAGFVDTTPFSIGSLPITIRGNPSNPSSCIVEPTAIGLASISSSSLAPAQKISFEGITLRGANRYEFTGGKVLIESCIVDADAAGNTPEFDSTGTAFKVRKTMLPDTGAWWNASAAFTVHGGSVSLDSVDVHGGARAVLEANSAKASIDSSSFQNFQSWKYEYFPDAILRFSGGSVLMTNSQLDEIRGPVGFRAINASTSLANNTFTNHGDWQGGYPIDISGPSCRIADSTFSSNGASWSSHQPGVGFINSPKFLIERCHFTSNFGFEYNTGAIELRGAGKVTDTEFASNWTEARAGAVLTECSQVAFERCQFLSNFAGDGGGAVYGYGGASFTQCEFKGNSSNDGTYQDGRGGAVWISGNVKFVRCTFEDNQTFVYSTGWPIANSGSGGAIAFGGGTLTIDRCDFLNNGAYGDGSLPPAKSAAGGAIAVFGGSVAISNSVFVGNHADNLGGAIAVFGGSCTLRRMCFVSGNSADPTVASGGGLYLNGGVGVIHNSYTCGNAPDNRVGPWVLDAWSSAWCP